MLLGSKDILRDLPEAIPVRVLASTNAVDSIAIADRHDLLGMKAVSNSAQKAYQMAKLTSADIDFFELHDVFSIMAVLLKISVPHPKGINEEYLVPDVSGFQTWLTPPPADPSVAHKGI